MAAQVLESRARLLTAAAAAADLAGHLSRLSTGTARAAAQLPRLPAQWQGAAARAAVDEIAVGRGNLERVAGATALAGVSLQELSAGLEWASAALPEAPGAGDPTGGRAALARAEGIAAEAAARCTQTLRILAEGAPPPRAVTGHLLDQVHTWGRAVLGTAESFTGLGDLVVQLATAPMSHDPAAAPPAPTAGQVFDAVTDRPTWQTDPARAVGHLAPDLLAAVLTGGSASAAAKAARVRTVVRLEAEAAARSSAREAAQTARRTALKTEAAEARRRLVDAAKQSTARRPVAEQPRPWTDGQGSTLDGRQSAQAEALHRLSAQVEPRVTADLQVIARDAQASLEGLENRVKEVESLKRSLALPKRGATWAQKLDGIDDILRYTMVMDTPVYTETGREIARLLSEKGYSLQRSWVVWERHPRYRGVNTKWVDPRTGAAFEVQFHTPLTRQASVRTHRWYEEWRLPGTSRQRQRELSDLIGAEFRKAPVPEGWQALDEKTLIPVPLPESAVLPADTALLQAIRAGAAAGAATQVASQGTNGPGR